GAVAVYAFDEDDRKSGDNSPTRTYYFEESDLKKLYSKSKLGPSYNFWIPWDADGPEGKAKKVSLIVRYVPKVGSSVVSSQTAAYIPGNRSQNQMLAKMEWEETNAEGTIQQVAFKREEDRKSVHEECLIESNEQRQSTMQTATIQIRR
ncbi:MAG: hypothetical protein ACRCUY_13070, partial [Thermoguttaceae bacterium]